MRSSINICYNIRFYYIIIVNAVMLYKIWIYIITGKISFIIISFNIYTFYYIKPRSKYSINVFACRIDCIYIIYRLMIYNQIFSIIHNHHINNRQNRQTMYILNLLFFVIHEILFFELIQSSIY